MNRVDSKNKVIAIIPARWGSTRLPGKPLADINGKPMIQWVYEAVKKSNADKVVIATDSSLIVEAVNSFGGDAILTKVSHPTGTDRILEAYQQYKEEYDLVINVQGDEPIINEQDINDLINVLKNNRSNISTLIGPLTQKQKSDRNTVKAILDHQEIVMFTRSPLFGSPLFVKRHIGIYGFSREMTEKINKNIMIETSNEIVENLEQIRWGDNGIKFSYARADGLYKGIDTQEDLDFVRTYLN